MSLSKINNFANDDTDILAVQTTVDALYQNSYSLTEYDSTTVPAIAAGSKIEVNGSLYRAATEEAISTTDPVTSSTVADGTVYICMIPSGDASTCTAAFTATAPTWSDSKQGWYGTGDQANYKYIGGCYKSSTSYYGKYKYISEYEKSRATKSYVSVYRSSNQTPSGETTIIFDTEIYDVLNEYNNSTGIFTAKEAGLYCVSLVTYSESIAAAQNSAANIYHKSTAVAYTTQKNDNAGAQGIFLTLSKTLFLDLGDTIHATIFNYNNAVLHGSTGKFTYMTIARVD